MQVRYLSWDFKTLPPGVRKWREEQNSNNKLFATKNGAECAAMLLETAEHLILCTYKLPLHVLTLQMNIISGGEKGSAHRAYELMIWCGNGCIHSLESSETQSLSYSCSASSANLNQILKIVTEEKWGRKRRWEKLEKLQKQQRRSSR